MENAKAKTLGAVNLDDLDYFYYCCFSIYVKNFMICYGNNKQSEIIEK
jgi:hypothetical protein